MTIASVPTKGRTLNYAAPVYDLLEPLCLLNRQAEYDQTLIKTLTPQPADRILDLGCGTGLLCQQISQTLDPALGGYVVGIDAAGNMIEAAREKRGSAHCQFEAMAAEQLSFDDAQFDAVISSLFYHHVPLDLKQRSLHEEFRVLKPGGRLIISDMDKPTTIIQHRQPPSVHKHLKETLAKDLPQSAFYAAWPELYQQLRAEAMHPLEQGLSSLFLDRHQQIVKPAAGFIAQRIGVDPN